MVTWIAKPWGISPHKKGKFYVVYGDGEMVACTGVFRNKRRAKKEITHYINKGLFKGPFHGAHKQLRLIN